MKKAFIYFTVASLFMVSSIKAQESSVGVKGGVNLSTLSIDDNNDKNMKIGFNVGVYNKISLTESFAIQPELLYSRQGIKVEYDGVADGETKFNLNYINVPVKLVFNLSEDFEFQLGPYVGYLINANLKTDADIFGEFEVNSEDDVDRKNFKSLDYGLTAGLGFDLDPLIIGLNYNLGLCQVAKDDEFSYDMLGDAKNRVIQISVGLKF
ncbi:Outer membrane protein beta-barrel domain-containing protein [Saccharicrinis carchari]|uniref:Outer membrane protein beta-barrel domain-containing protein n=1 Tax=Saccharicrinis carchari TaxID=1168039 RepID=A0A521CGE8_SACCC|nr:porin family protein [Saccharicrinis carchari]SMO58508.1 Outer membrane protein beta-barrel domain-containing protein [Saccharicrinis carchari]